MIWAATMPGSIHSYDARMKGGLLNAWDAPGCMHLVSAPGNLWRSEGRMGEEPNPSTGLGQNFVTARTS